MIMSSKKIKMEMCRIPKKNNTIKSDRNSLTELGLQRRWWIVSKMQQKKKAKMLILDKNMIKDTSSNRMKGKSALNRLPRRGHGKKLEAGAVTPISYHEVPRGPERVEK